MVTRNCPGNSAASCRGWTGILRRRESSGAGCRYCLMGIATLLELNRIKLSLPLREWLDRATAPPRVECTPITPAVAAEVAALPGWFHRDPADRIIVATARIHGARLLTRDERIIDAGLVETVS